MSLLPDSTGNAINGLNERDFRRAHPVYWREPDTLDFGELQRWFYKQDPDNALIEQARAKRDRILEERIDELASEAVQWSAQKWSRELAEFADSLDVELFGVTRFRNEWLFDDAELRDDWVVVVGMAHDYERICEAPRDVAGAEVVRQYGRGARAVRAIASWFHRHGWEATIHGGPMAGSLLMIPAAIECGFGELGRHGSVINRKYGSSFRLACVTTRAPLVATPAESYGVDDFCTRCQVCADACPPEAIGPEKVWVRGELKWYVDFDKCLPFFNEHYGCGICIAVCPWSKPGVGERIIEQLARRRARS